MPHVTTMRTITRLLQDKGEISEEPAFKIGHYVEKLSDGTNCTVRDIRFNLEKNQYEYLDGGMCSSGWLPERSINLA